LFSCYIKPAKPEQTSLNHSSTVTKFHSINDSPESIPSISPYRTASEHHDSFPNSPLSKPILHPQSFKHFHSYPNTLHQKYSVPARPLLNPYPTPHTHLRTTSNFTSPRPDSTRRYANNQAWRKMKNQASGYMESVLAHSMLHALEDHGEGVRSGRKRYENTYLLTMRSWMI
jgi:hypothetical protein